MNLINRVLMTAISCIACFTIVSCSNDEPILSNVKDAPISESFKNTNTVVWDTIVCNQLSKNQIYIGSRYLGIQNWDCNGNPPGIYPGAVFLRLPLGISLIGKLTA